MAAHHEADFVVPMLKVIKKYPNGCGTDIIIDNIGAEIELTTEDLEESESRKNESKYKQIIRNLISHKNKKFFNNVTIEIIDGKRNFKINAAGIEFLKDFDKSNEDEDSIEITESKDAYVEVEDGQDIYDKKLLNMFSNPSIKKPYKDKSLSESIKKIHNYECLYTKIINGPKRTYIGADGNDYVEVHHLIPMCAWRDFFPKHLDRPSNLVPLADCYHGALHHGSDEEKKKILKTLYDAMILGLNNDGIYIDFDTLFNKYYSKENYDGK